MEISRKNCGGSCWFEKEVVIKMEALDDSLFGVYCK
jgi:hypothetical protein